MAAHFPIRAVEESEFDAFRRSNEHAFHDSPPSERHRAEMLDRLELDRTLAAFDGATPVASAAIWSFRMAVPGALAEAAGVTWIAVMPSYRRRGILSSLMRRQIDDIHERGEPIAVLWASDARIYGRYGYGRASWHASLTVRDGEGALRSQAPADPALRLRITEPDAALAELAKVYDTLLPTQPGFFVRDESWWNHIVEDPDEGRPGSMPVRCVLAEDDAGPRGYALYSARGRWDEDTFLPDSTLDIRELVATDPAATAMLWSDLLNRDLVSEVTARLRPAGDPLLHLLADPRRARPRVSDGLWVRIIDVPAALSARRYAAPVDLVIKITDEMCPWNEGLWRLRASGPVLAGPGTTPGAGTAECERTTGAPEVVLPAATLGAAYLGGTSLGTLARAGLAHEVRGGALAALSAALSWDPAPWCPTIF
ncbi:MAG TPA: GNAT family N-acetyltransferase [Streptosporangiaceae bacterium]|nr:GNAT family N-acetyltransferase [Streptosporangiaceae bacterium]